MKKIIDLFFVCLIIFASAKALSGESSGLRAVIENQDTNVSDSPMLEIDQKVEEIKRFLVKNSKKQSALVKAQEAWVKFIELQCDFESIDMKNKNFKSKSDAMLYCKNSFISNRLDELQQIERDLR